MWGRATRNRLGRVRDCAGQRRGAAMAPKKTGPPRKASPTPEGDGRAADGTLQAAPTGESAAAREPAPTTPDALSCSVTSFSAPGGNMRWSRGGIRGGIRSHPWSWSPFIESPPSFRHRTTASVLPFMRRTLAGLRCKFLCPLCFTVTIYPGGYISVSREPGGADCYPGLFFEPAHDPGCSFLGWPGCFWYRCLVAIWDRATGAASSTSAGSFSTGWRPIFVLAFATWHR